jgi:hypothetical protein
MALFGNQKEHHGIGKPHSRTLLLISGLIAGLDELSSTE